MHKMRYIQYTILFFIIGSYTVYSQNLVPNNSFDSYTSPPNDIAQICKATGWSSPSGLCASGNGGTPDYFHTAGSGVIKPPNMAWATLSPQSGGGMAGFGTYFFVPANWREYIRCQLTAPMVIGTLYEVSFWLSNGENSILTVGTNNIGIAFTSTQLTQSVTSPITSVTPQVEITSVVFTETWQKFTFYYTATAPFKYMTIGNFRTDAATSIAMQSSNPNSGCYYYIDDVIVQPFSILPVELLYFNAIVSESSEVELNWATASEKDTKDFTIERSNDALIFSALASIPGISNSISTHEYSFIDMFPVDGVSYYRLRVNDFDGTYSYSKVVSLVMPTVAQKDLLQIFPNPAFENFSLKTQFALNQGDEVVLADQAGKFCYRSVIPVDDTNNIVVNVANLPSGIYIVMILSSEIIIAGSKVIIPDI